MVLEEFSQFRNGFAGECYHLESVVQVRQSNESVLLWSAWTAHSGVDPKRFQFAGYGANHAWTVCRKT